MNGAYMLRFGLQVPRKGSQAPKLPTRRKAGAYIRLGGLGSAYGGLISENFIGLQIISESLVLFSRLTRYQI